MKKIIIIIIILFNILILININLKKTNKSNNKIPYYKETYQQRYKSYKKKHPELNTENIIINVNLGLDYPFYTHTKISNLLNNNLILINKYIQIPSNYIPNNLTKVNINSKGNIYLVEEASIAYLNMSQAIKKSNLKIRLISGYRSYDYQLNLYNNYLKTDNQSIVDTYSARPGFSEHHTGLTIDIDNVSTSFNYFEYTDEYQWMQKNAYKYGFILRYPKNKENITGYTFEAWHYRYVGKKVASYIHKHNLAYEEYFIKFIEKSK